MPEDCLVLVPVKAQRHPAASIQRFKAVVRRLLSLIHRIQWNVFLRRQALTVKPLGGGY